MTIYDDSVKISVQQLKQTNLIFLEHEHLKKKVPLLEQEIEVLDYENQKLIEQDSIKTKEFEKKEKKLKKKATFAGAGGLLLSLLILIFK